MGTGTSKTGIYSEQEHLKQENSWEQENKTGIQLGTGTPKTRIKLGTGTSIKQEYSWEQKHIKQEYDWEQENLRQEKVGNRNI